MKNLITTIFLIGILSVFLIFISETEKTKEVLEVYTPTKIGIDIDKNKTISNEEIFCIEGVESFSLEPSEEFYNNNSKQYNLTNEDFNSEIKEGMVLVDFYADWCGPCRMLSPVIEELARELPDLKVIKVNVDEREDIAKMFGVMSIPTLILFRDGQMNKKQVGFIPKEVLMRWFN